MRTRPPNQLTQAIIGAKEGATTAIREKVGDAIANTVLRTADGVDKGIDEYELHELVQAIHRHAQRPKYAAPRNILIELASYQFDF